MHLFSILIFLLASAEGVFGGSRFWEAKAPNKRTNPRPDYSAIETINATSSLSKRAFSIESRPGQAELPRIWPKKTIRYCFENSQGHDKLEGLFRSAIELWAQLNRHGFKYEEVSDAECKSEDKRDSVLHIHYNDYGRFSTTLGIPVVDAQEIADNPTTAVRGPTMHLSDKEGVGQENTPANIAHELGHAWGLAHEHQNPYYWEQSSITGPSWSVPMTGKKYFETDDFNCGNLEDHYKIHKSVQVLIDTEVDLRKRDILQGEYNNLCVLRGVASKYGFSAADWLPISNTANMVIDAQFDPDSIMLYPSQAGGGDNGANRRVIMKYKKDSMPDQIIPIRHRPSNMDVDRIVALYGDPAPSTLEVPHNSGSSEFHNRLKDARSSGEFSRAGDTKDGTCG
ncbi:uncharacterized protein J4E88_001054 [Alternaria novae-zelandiae]|uniref:uncharacterized protein n=1 Tax=Alternaria novae-zelandiae TaxID=430562 RepID=UPI0020C53489|nr:uncharacterized protein J4E88_001054 [Alternaria novae-zelandiae]KAI4696875.1 hypothetical protein J4E88_001054 [Alternaria novae-zelandiae]